MKSELDTLFLPFTNGLLEYPSAKSSVLFANARHHGALAGFGSCEVTTQQVFKPYAALLEAKGYEVLPDPSALSGREFDHVLLLATKNQRESENILAKSALPLKTGGMMIFAADNKSGGTRIKNMLVKLGFTGIAEHSKNKARVVWAEKPKDFNEDLAREWAALDQVQEIKGGFQSRLGLYGWNKIDKGSEILAAHLPRDIKGKGADFGCGYGYLSKAVLEATRKAKSLDYMDADFRALEMCKANLEGYEVKTEGFWIDLADPSFPIANKYDWIVMNPPFHEGKKTDADIGLAFIKNAHKALMRKGRLFMVANRHLPYEAILESHFWRFETLSDANGFKVFEAIK